MERMFSGVSPELMHDIVWGRMQRMFNIKGPDAI
jgi:hypothetical protein